MAGTVWTSSLSAGLSLEDRLHESDLRALLQEQQAELLGVQCALDEVKQRGCRAATATSSSLPSHLKGLQVRQAAEALTELQQRVRPEWLSRPATSIEHELARRRHMAEAHRLEAIIAEADAPARPQAWQDVEEMSHMDCGHLSMLAASPALAAWPPSARPPPQPDPSLAFPRHVEIPPADILVERKRRFGDRLFRLWVEDCASQGGVRVHAMDVLSLCRSHVDLRDCDIQAMFNNFVARCRDSSEMARWIAGEAQSLASSHDRELLQFLSFLLDAAYFELDDSGNALQLRLPAFVEPPLAMPSEERTLIQVDRPRTPSSPSSPLKASWIREQLLVPRSMATDRSSGQRSRSQHCRSQSSHPSKASTRSSPTCPPGGHKTSAVYAAPSCRPQSARCSGTTARREGVKGGSLRLRSARQAPVSASTDSSHGTSFFFDMSMFTNPNASVSVFSDGNSSGLGAQRSRQRLAGGRQPPHLPRPTSVREPRVAASRAADGAVLHGGHRAKGDLSRPQSARSAPCTANAEPEPVPYPPSQPRPAGVRGRSFPGSSGEALPMTELLVQDTAVMTATCASSPLVADCGRGILRHCKQADKQGTGQVAVARHRQLRPTSAKATKHKRVADNHERSSWDVYEDYEDSEPDVYDGEHDTFETDVPLTEGRGQVPLLVPPKPPGAPSLAAEHMERPAVPQMACRSTPASSGQCIGGFWPAAGWSDRAQGPSPLDPRASTPPRRPHIVA